MQDPEVTRDEKKPKRRRTLLQRIVNVFLYIGVVTLGILIFVFGFSQTQTFRNWLRDFVVEQANDNLNGKVSIEKIEGTLFTSLILRNTVVTMEKDTLLNAGLIEVRTSPLKIFLKIIHVRKVEIKDTRISFIEDSSGVLNISKLFPPPDEEEDTTESHFPFRIEVAEFKLTNLDFSLQKYDRVGSNELYPALNMDDFRVEDIFLSLSAFADIDNNNFETKINYLQLNPNLTVFNLKSLSGEFGVNPKEIIANNLIVTTTNSDIGIKAKVNGLNIFDSTITENIEYAVVDISIESKQFNFDDLSSFVPPIDMLKGVVGIQLQASGNLLQLDINKIVLDYEKTHLETKAVVRNINNIDEMTIAALFKNSYINQTDIDKLLPEIGVPTFEKLGVVKIDSLSFDGKPLNFKSRMVLSTNNGSLASFVKMNLEKSIPEYDVSLSTKDFNLFPISGISSKLNLRGNFVGSGFSPKEMNNNILLVGEGSTVEGIEIDSVSLTAQAKDGIVNYSLFNTSDKSKAEIDGSLDFMQENLGYKASGVVRNLDIGNLMNDSTIITDLNFNFETEGENFDIDIMNMFLTFDLSPSSINGIQIDSLRTITDIFTDINNERVINFISDIADVTFKGQFLLTDALPVLTKEAELLTDVFMKKINEILPSDVAKEEILTELEQKKLKRNSTPKENVSLLYLVDFKDFEIISSFLQDKKLEIDGDLAGNILYNRDSIYLTLSTDLNYIKYWGQTEAYFLSKLKLELDLANGFDIQSSEDIGLGLSARASRIFAGTDLNNLYLDFNLHQDIAKVNLGLGVENYASAKLTCLADLSTSKINFDVDTLDFIYNGFDFRNKEKLNLTFSHDRIDIKKFQLYHLNGEISAIGFLAAKEDQYLNLSVKNLKGNDLFQSFSSGNGFSSMDIDLNLEGVVTGNYSEPVLDIDLNGKNLTYKEKNFGDLVSKFRYDNRNFSADIKFFESFGGSTSPALKLFGNIPINLSSTDTGKVLLDEDDIEVNLISNNLDLTPFGELIPGVSKFKGNLNSNIQITGSMQEPYPDGYLTLDNSSFLFDYNNLEYKAGLKINVARDYFSIDSLLLSNSADTKLGGSITGGGTAELENLSMSSSQFVLNGRLKVLGNESKYVSPNLYGDLVISTNGNFELKFDRNGANLKAPITIEVAKLTYSTAKGSYTSASENFIYKFVEDTVTIKSAAVDFDALVNLSKQSEKEKIEKAAKPGKFNYSIDVEVEDEATLTYVLSREFNQNLVAILSGKFQFESIDDKPIAQGELQLLEGSTLEFIKTLNAEGKIRFESDLSNPYLDIVAIYKNYYYPETTTSNSEGEQSSSEEVEVAVKMKIKGTLDELDKNLAQQSDKLAVYYGTKNIEDDIPDPTKDASDAVMFLLLDKFNDNVTQQERNIVSSYATSFAGSIVGGFLNRQFGDYVKNLEIRQTGTDTKFILAGRAGKFRYSIGGSTAVFQDLGLANVKIEYPITRSFFMRLERKEALSQTQYSDEMINELGLKYRFEF